MTRNLRARHSGRPAVVHSPLRLGWRRMESRMSKRSLLCLTPVLIVLAWYGLVYLFIRPLTDAPVLDSWVYEHAVRWFELKGSFQFPGFTQAMPIGQVLYVAGWSRLFGFSSKSLD